MAKYIGFTPFEAQQKIIDAILSSDKMYHVFKVGRRFGKTLMAQNLALYWTINNNDTSLLWLSPTHSQAKKVMTELFKALKGSDLVKTFNQTDRAIEFTNGSSIWFSGVDKGDSIRGSGYNFAIADEQAHWKKGTFETIVRPLLLVGGKKCLIISTPKGRNDFHKLYNLGLDPTTNYQSYSASIYESPLINVQEIEDAKVTVPDFIFKQEYEAEFLDDDFAVFKSLDNVFTVNKFEEPIYGEKYYAGLDLANRVDFTSLVILDAKGKCVHIYRDQHKTWPLLIESINAVLTKYKPLLVCEVNNIGDVVYDMLKLRYKNMQPFVTNPTSKSNIVEELIVRVANAQVSLPSSALYPMFRSEFEMFGYKYNPNTRHVKYAAEEGHDDIVMSTALAVEAMKNGLRKGIYKII